MAAYQGMIFDVMLESGRKVSTLERTLELNGPASISAGFEVPKTRLSYVTYTPRDDLAVTIGKLIQDQRLLHLYLNGSFAAEKVVANLKNPPLQRMDLRVFTFYLSGGTQGAQSNSVGIVSVIGQDGKIMSTSNPTFSRPTLHRKYVPAQEFTYRDWKELSDMVQGTAQRSFFVANLNSHGFPDRKNVSLNLEGSNSTYSPNGNIIYSSSNHGFIETFDEDTEEISILDNLQIPDEHRLPILAALLASQEYTRSELEVSSKGVLDSMSPTTNQQARYRICVSHLSGLQFEVEIRMGNAITGNSFGPTTIYTANLDKKKVQKK